MFGDLRKIDLQNLQIIKQLQIFMQRTSLIMFTNLSLRLKMKITIQGKFYKKFPDFFSQWYIEKIIQCVLQILIQIVDSENLEIFELYSMTLTIWSLLQKKQLSAIYLN